MSDRALTIGDPEFHPKRCETNEVGAFGECIFCDADQGEACRPTVRPLSVLGAKRKNTAYSRARAAWRAEHPLGPVEVTEKAT